MINNIDFNNDFTIDEFIEYTITNKILNVNENDILTRLAKCVNNKFETKNRLSGIFSSLNGSNTHKLVFNAGFTNAHNISANAKLSQKNNNNEYYNKIKLKYINTVNTNKTVLSKKRELLTKSAPNKSKKPNILNWFKKENPSSTGRNPSVGSTLASTNPLKDDRTRGKDLKYESPISDNFYKLNHSRTPELKSRIPKRGQTVLKSDLLNIDTYGTVFLSNDTSFLSSISGSELNSDYEFLDFCTFSKGHEGTSNATDLVIAKSPKNILPNDDPRGSVVIEEIEISPDSSNSPAKNNDKNDTSQEVIVIEDSTPTDDENQPTVPELSCDVAPYDIHQSQELTLQEATSENVPETKIKEEYAKTELSDHEFSFRDGVKTEDLHDDVGVAPHPEINKVDPSAETNEEIKSLGVNVVILFGEESNKNVGLVACWFATKIFGCTMEQLVQNGEKNPEEYLLVRNWRLQYINCEVFSQGFLPPCVYSPLTNDPNSPSNSGPITSTNVQTANAGLDSNTLTNLVSTVTNKNSKVCVIEGFDLLPPNTQILLNKYFSKVYDKVFVLTCGRLFRVENRIKSYSILVRLAGFSTSSRIEADPKCEYAGDEPPIEFRESQGDPTCPVDHTAPCRSNDSHFSSDLTVGTFRDLFAAKSDGIDSSQRDSDVEVLGDNAHVLPLYNTQSNSVQDTPKYCPPSKPDLPAVFWESQQSIIPHLNRVPVTGDSSPKSTPEKETDEKNLVDYLFNVATSRNVKLSKLNLSSILHSVGFNLLMVYNILSKLMKNNDKPKFYLYKHVVSKNPQIAASASNGKLVGNLVYIILNFVPPNSGSDEKRAHKYGLRDNRAQAETLLPNGQYSHHHFSLMSSDRAPHTPRSMRHKLFDFICENPYLGKILGSIIGYYYPHNLNDLLTDLYEAMTRMDKHRRLDPLRAEIVAFFAGFNFCSALNFDPNFTPKTDSQNESRREARLVADGNIGRTASQRDNRTRPSQTDAERPNPTAEELALKHLEFLLKNVIFNLIALINNVN